MLWHFNGYCLAHSPKLKWSNGSGTLMEKKLNVFFIIKPFASLILSLLTLIALTKSHWRLHEAGIGPFLLKLCCLCTFCCKFLLPQRHMLVAVAEHRNCLQCRFVMLCYHAGNHNHILWPAVWHNTLSLQSPQVKRHRKQHSAYSILISLYFLWRSCMKAGGLFH